MSAAQVHVINHTHWDREWFLTSVYTSRWIPGLIDKLEQLSTASEQFRYFFDGQTLVIEDLLAVAPTYAERVAALIAHGRLTIGPYYCQPDWQLTGGELLMRNLQLGLSDVARYHGRVPPGWLVDTFGHISQAPQIHRLYGIDAAFVWRGVPELTPYFHWEAPDGSRLLAINLFGGYRNLYGVTHAPEVAAARLEAEIAKLRPYYPTADIPLFDGYDLETDPEDPVRFYAGLEAGALPQAELREATPASFAAAIRAQALALPTLPGELNSGRYGATFPGTFSARTYLKVMARDCEHLLFQVCEPLATLARLHGRDYPTARYESWVRLLLQNAVHDCICGVSIDQVHEKMAHSYRRAFDEMLQDAEASLAHLLAGFTAGHHAVSTNPIPHDGWHVAGDALLHVCTEGVGVWPIVERRPVTRPQQAVTEFTWHNDHYHASVAEDGSVRVNGDRLGRLVVLAESGDTYSDEAGAVLGALQPAGPLIVDTRSDIHVTLTFTAAWQSDAARVSAAVALTFDNSPLIRWQIDLDSHGRDLRVEMLFDGPPADHVVAGMPFDIVERPAVSTDLLPRDLPDDLARILLGQRELNQVTSFPFHDFVAVSGPDQMLAVLAKGVRAYATAPGGTLRLVLRRAVEWLTRADLRDRVGDAGPFFYVPDARCERVVRHEIAVAVGLDSVESPAFQALNAAFQNPPLLVASAGGGSRTAWQLLQEPVPLSSLQIQNGRVIARYTNPTNTAVSLSRPLTQVDVWGKPAGTLAGIGPKQIVSVQLPVDLPELRDQTTEARLLAPPVWRVGENHGLPDTAVMDKLARDIDVLEADIQAVERDLAGATGSARLRLQHRLYVLQREQAEFRLSLLLNRRKLAEQGALRDAYLYEPDPEIAEVGQQLNALRIKRRIFDYVIQVS